MLTAAENCLRMILRCSVPVLEIYDLTDKFDIPNPIKQFEACNKYEYAAVWNGLKYPGKLPNSYVELENATSKCASKAVIHSAGKLILANGHHL